MSTNRYTDGRWWYSCSRKWIRTVLLFISISFSVLNTFMLHFFFHVIHFDAGSYPSPTEFENIHGTPFNKTLSNSHMGDYWWKSIARLFKCWHICSIYTVMLFSSLYVSFESVCLSSAWLCYCSQSFVLYAGKNGAIHQVIQLNHIFPYGHK